MQPLWQWLIGPVDMRGERIMPGRLRLRTALIITLALLATTAADARQPGTPTKPMWDIIAFEMKSWGRPVHSWMIMSEGSGSFATTMTKPDAPFSQYRIEFREVEAGKPGYAELQQLLAKLPEPAPDSNMCINRMTDMPYGTIRMTRAATTVEIAWDSGCQDSRYRAFMDILKAADQKVEAWGRAGKILRTEEVGGTSG
jgi:hypothetical protein